MRQKVKACLCVSPQVDNTGLPKLLDLDDHEMMVMGMLLRTGLWMRDEVMNRLGVERWVVPLPAHSSRVSSTVLIGTLASMWTIVLAAQCFVNLLLMLYKPRLSGACACPRIRAKSKVLLGPLPGPGLEYSSTDWVAIA